MSVVLINGTQALWLTAGVLGVVVVVLLLAWFGVLK